MTISISDLSPVTSEDLLTSIDQEEGGVIKSAVARALAARQVVGGTTVRSTKVDSTILVKSIKLLTVEALNVPSKIDYTIPVKPTEAFTGQVVYTDPLLTVGIIMTSVPAVSA